ncbi:Hypothetical Protein FCC1311_029112 [Hondaea fermentalgiana]|uniref:Uncharacterized protein n=1 Tax=Hondaea fermentalgiana TaxID=2315210 RepID=A0A2R5G6R8_9STRA|nr:Hypothetical Protein FCC1311_029112 [Hondaea fermentalgiana]|eukprot:GBG26690.1 Hypothetical Protein FCC1311_029112 [Hondaea fermentalgiana]
MGSEVAAVGAAEDGPARGRQTQASDKPFFGQETYFPRPPQLRRLSEWSGFPFAHKHHVKITSKKVVRAASLIGWNALIMFLSEVVIEILMVAKVMPKIPFRLDFFALTTISALLGYQTLVGVARRELDVTRNSLILAFYVEGFLIVGDIQFLLEDTYTLLLAVRIPFIVLTFVNFVLVIWMYFELHNTFRPDWPILFDVLFLRNENKLESGPARDETLDDDSSHSDGENV